MINFKRKIFGINVHLDMSIDVFKDLRKESYTWDKVQPYLERLVICLKWNPKLEKVIDSLDNMAILYAHGSNNEGSWNYQEKRLLGLKERNVQDWINKHDGKYDLLLIACCNSDNKGKAKSMLSTLVYPSTDFSPLSIKFYDEDYLRISNHKP